MAVKLHYQQNQNRTRELFSSVSGEIANILQARIIADLESHDNHLSTTLDQEAGLDYLMQSANGIFAIAWRAQPSDVNWRTFTVRSKRLDSKRGERTELDKLRDAITSDTIRPTYTVQGYFTNDHKFLGGAIVKTRDLITLINDGLSTQRETHAKGAAIFEVVPFKLFVENDMFIKPIRGV